MHAYRIVSSTWRHVSNILRIIIPDGRLTSRGLFAIIKSSYIFFLFKLSLKYSFYHELLRFIDSAKDAHDVVTSHRV